MNENRTKDSSDPKPANGGVQFRSRKRPKKARTKIEVKEEDNAGADHGPSALTVAEMTILNEAQEMREQARMATLTSISRDPKPKVQDPESPIKEADDPIGLKQSFAEEKSSHVVEERMTRYIEEKMAEKFKDRRTVDEKKSTNDSDVFAIPDLLKVDEKPLYDPGEGLPAAGIEEVALPDEVRLRNETETRTAQKEALRRRETTSNATSHIPGNVSANFAKHRYHWTQGNATRPDQGGLATARKTEPNDKTTEEDTAKRRRYQTASDAAVADRFRKRWKR